MSRARDVSQVGVALNQTVTATSSTNVPFTITGASGQTANLLNIKNSAGTTVSSIGPDGRLYAVDSIIQVKRHEWGTETAGVVGYTNATNSSFTFTPLRANSKILLVAEIATAPYGPGLTYAGMTWRILRDGTPLYTPGQTHEFYVGDATDHYTRGVRSHYINANSTAATTFSLQFASYGSSTARINQAANWQSYYTIYEVAQ
jgi:hypothetical protein